MKYREKLKYLETLISKAFPQVIIPYIEIDEKIYCFGNINEQENLRQAIDYIFEGVIPEIRFNSIDEIQKHNRKYFHNFTIIDIKEDIKEIINIFK